jgi:hypothetical protein
MAEANPTEVQALVNQILAELDKIVQKRIAEAKPSAPAPLPPAGGGVSVDTKLHFLAKMVYNLCMQTGMTVPKELHDMKK